jgi:hypothetical protein
MSKTKIGLGLAALGRPEYINIRIQLLINPKRLLLRMLLVFLILPINMVFVILIQLLSYGKGEEFLTNWNSKYQHEDVSLSTKWGYTYVANWELGFRTHEVKNIL